MFDVVKYNAAKQEYQDALKFTTSGVPSSSVICQFFKWDETERMWVDGTEAYRESIANTNLR